jgi:hypothetical protein
MIVTIWTKPDQGNIQRTCRICGETYQGWNFVRCAACAHIPVEVAHVWRDYVPPTAATGFGR